jgi:hypothetical protein
MHFHFIRYSFLLLFTAKHAFVQGDSVRSLSNSANPTPEKELTTAKEIDEFLLEKLSPDVKELILYIHFPWSVYKQTSLNLVETISKTIDDIEVVVLTSDSWWPRDSIVFQEWYESQKATLHVEIGGKYRTPIFKVELGRIVGFTLRLTSAKNCLNCLSDFLKGQESEECTPKINRFLGHERAEVDWKCEEYEKDEL